jgi:hypothetical protein
MVNLCPWRDIFGSVREGVHSWRIVGDSAGIDYFGTIFLSMLFTYLTGIPLDIVTVGMFVLSMVMHWLFCVPTNFNKWILGDTKFTF